MGIKMDFLDDKFERIDSDTTDPKFFWDEFHRITEILDSDLSAIKRIIDLDDSQFWRRVYFRTFFSYLDGFVYSLCQLFLFFNWFTVLEK